MYEEYINLHVFVDVDYSNSLNSKNDSILTNRGWVTGVCLTMIMYG